MLVCELLQYVIPKLAYYISIPFTTRWFANTMVQIFSNFDTRFDDVAFEKAKREFGKWKVCFVRRDKIYVVFKILIPIFLRLIWSMLFLALGYWTDLIELLWAWFWVFIWLCIWLSGAVLSWIMTNKFIDYYMDFTIITPKRITSYDQTWIFTRAERVLDISKIKSVRVLKTWVFHSIFNYWSIVFFSEWDDKNWDITLNYITDPNKLSARVWQILELDAKSISTI